MSILQYIVPRATLALEEELAAMASAPHHERGKRGKQQFRLDDKERTNIGGMCNALLFLRWWL